MRQNYDIQSLPSRKVAVKMANAYLQERIYHGSHPQIIFEHGTHVFNVAKIAEAIAKRTHKLNPEVAYILGLLHDIGRVKDETLTGVPHTLEGYQYLREKGYLRAAKICVTHSFINPNFKDSDFPAYSKQALQAVRGLLKNIRYDDYDKLIQLSDLFSRGKEILSIRQRLDKNKRFYHIPNLSYENEAFALRDYFNRKYHLDVEQVVADTFSMYKHEPTENNRDVFLYKQSAEDVHQLRLSEQRV